MRQFAFVVSVSIAALFAVPSSAALVGGTNIDLSTQPFTINFNGGTFTFSFDRTVPFGTDPVSLRTGGTGEVTAFGGFLGIPLAPSGFQTFANVEFGPNTFPGFAPIPTATVIPASAAILDLGLRVSNGRDFFYGYARLGGSQIDSYAFETTPNRPITAGSLVAGGVPEPASWAMMLGGFGLVGGAMRRQRVMVRYA